MIGIARVLRACSGCGNPDSLPMFTLITHLRTLGGRARDAGGTQAPQELVVGPGICIDGLFTCDGLVRVEGCLRGEVRCRTLLVSPGGLVEGRVVAEHADIYGSVQGDIFAQFLELRTDCSVEGEIYHADLHLEEGSWFEGKSRRHPNAVAFALAGAQNT